MTCYRPMTVLAAALLFGTSAVSDDILGTIWLDSVTFLARRIELEYVDGAESRGTFRADFGDVAVAGGTLRMPIGGAFAMRPSRKNPALRTEGKVTVTYSGFEEVPQRR
jgi:hypothetical protein